MPTSAAAASHDVKVPPPPPEWFAARRARRLRGAHVTMIASMVFFGALSLAPAHMIPRAAALLGFWAAALGSLALCAPAIGKLRDGRGPRIAFLLGLVPGGVLVTVGAVTFVSALSELGAALGLHALGVVGWVFGLLLTSLAIGVLGLFAHRPLGAGTVVSFVVLAAGAVSFVLHEEPPVEQRFTIDGTHALVSFPAGFSGPLELSSSCGAFAIEHTGLSGVLRRPILSCEVGRTWMDPCAARIKDIVTAPDGFRVHLVDGSTVVVSPDGSALRCESNAPTCHLSCYRPGRPLPDPVDVVARPTARQ